MAASIFTNPLYISFVVVAVVVGVIFILFRNKLKKIPGFKEFQPQDLSMTYYEELKRKLDTIGIKAKNAHLYMGYNKIAIIDKYKVVKGKFSVAVYDQKNKEVSVLPEEKDVEYDLMLLRAKSNNFIKRIIGFGKSYFIIKMKDGDKELVYHDTDKNKFFITRHSDITSYGKVWTNCQDSIEYLNDISMKRINEETMMHLENLPNKVVHLELEQAKKERTGMIFTNLEKSKYDERKSADETIVS